MRNIKCLRRTWSVQSTLPTVLTTVVEGEGLSHRATVRPPCTPPANSRPPTDTPQSWMWATRGTPLPTGTLTSDPLLNSPPTILTPHSPPQTAPPTTRSPISPVQPAPTLSTPWSPWPDPQWSLLCPRPLLVSTPEALSWVSCPAPAPPAPTTATPWPTTCTPWWASPGSPSGTSTQWPAVAAPSATSWTLAQLVRPAPTSSL